MSVSSCRWDNDAPCRQAAEDDPLCTEAVPFPDPRIGYPLLPPYQYHYDWRMEAGDERIGVKEETASEARGAIAKTEKEAKANPDDPLVDESKVLVAYTEEQIARAEEELAQGKELQQQIAAQEERNEDLYDGWEDEYDELYDNFAC